MLNGKYSTDYVQAESATKRAGARVWHGEVIPPWEVARRTPLTSFTAAITLAGWFGPISTRRDRRDHAPQRAVRRHGPDKLTYLESTKSRPLPRDGRDPLRAGRKHFARLARTVLEFSLSRLYPEQLCGERLRRCGCRCCSLGMEAR